MTMDFALGAFASSVCWLGWLVWHRGQCLCVPRSKVVIDWDGKEAPKAGQVYDKGLWHIAWERFW